MAERVKFRIDWRRTTALRASRFPKKIQWCLNALISGNFNSAYRLVFGSIPVGLLRWGGMDEDIPHDQETSSSGKFAQQWKLNTMAQEAALKEVAKNELRRLSAGNTSSNCTDIKMGDSALS